MKQRKTLALIVTTFLTFLAVAAFAAPGDRLRGDGHRGGGPGRGMFPPPGYLDLSAEQIEATQAIREGVRAELSANREETRTLRESLKAALDGDNPDSATVGQMMIDLHGLRQQTRATMEAAESQFAALLDAEQLEKWENFKELRQSRRGPGRHRGHSKGGPAGPFGAGFGAGSELPEPIG